ncbi:MAG TPA: hypothetical protein VLQ20_04175 [Planococcus sp. (in: firmicutes)]|nr:hypothetical protein [Planococcus sp. (in: firmicutes)]
MEILKIISMLFLLLFISGCSSSPSYGNLERVMIQNFDGSGQEIEEKFISNEEELKELYDLVEKAEWKDSSEPVTNKNMTITFLHNIHNGEPERLVRYDILLDEAGEYSILLNEEGTPPKLGVLSDSNSSFLQELLKN